MNAEARRQKYREELRADLLKAARDLFIRDGYESFSMRKLAEKVGYTHGTIYLYFENKEQLFDCLVEESFAQLSEALQGLANAHPEYDPVQLLKAAARVYIEFGLKNPGAYEFAFIIRRTGEPRPWQPHAAFHFASALVERCVREKYFREVDAATAAQAMWAAVHGVTSLLILRPSFPWVDRERLIQQVIDQAVDGLIAARKPTKRQGAKRGTRRSR